jgi:hypothetical protein
MEREQWAKPRRGGRNGEIEPGTVIVSWRRLSQAEHDFISADRPGVGAYYRRAIVDNAGAIQHDIAKARGCHRDRLRHERAFVMPQLDNEWMRATRQKDRPGLDAVEIEQQKWADAPADPRIDAAQTVEELKQITVI